MMIVENQTFFQVIETYVKYDYFDGKLRVSLACARAFDPFDHYNILLQNNPFYKIGTVINSNNNNNK